MKPELCAFLLRKEVISHRVQLDQNRVQLDQKHSQAERVLMGLYNYETLLSFTNIITGID